VHEDILAAVVRLNKSKSFSRVEPLHRTCRHCPHSLLNQWLQPRSAGQYTARKTRRREPAGLFRAAYYPQIWTGRTRQP
jgi:hypothetical protein